VNVTIFTGVRRLKVVKFADVVFVVSGARFDTVTRLFPLDKAHARRMMSGDGSVGGVVTGGGGATTVSFVVLVSLHL
jgi:hypothetical protein